MSVETMEEMYDKWRKTSAISTPKTTVSHSDFSETRQRQSGSSVSGPRGQKKSLKQMTQDKKIAEDEFMAAAIGDDEWLKHSLRGYRGRINYDKKGLASVHIAAVYGRLQCLKILIEKFNIDVNLPSTNGWRPLHLVISNTTGKRAFQCMMYLLEKEADPSVVNEDGISPMHQAASEGHVQCLKALIDTGCQVDGQDNRGHRPIDLAKLWGHRKCARLLASVQWHQEKDFLSAEMKQLHRLKIQHVLHEMEVDEQNKAHQEFYGNLAFNEWLEKHGVRQPPQRAPSSTKDRTSRGRTSANVVRLVAPSPGGGRNMLAKPNSLRGTSVKVTAMQPDKMENVSASGCGDQRQTRQQQLTVPDSHPRSSTSAANIKEPDEGAGSPRGARPATVAGDGQCGLYTHSQAWNKSTKLPGAPYTPILEDHYPRDEYSMLPKNPPKRGATLLDLKNPIEGLVESFGGGGDKLHMDKIPQLPKDVIAKTLAPPGSYERPVVYKCKHIQDVRGKKHAVPDSQPRSESGIHLTNDTTSRLFRSALLIPPTGHADHRRPEATERQDLELLLRRVGDYSGPSTHNAAHKTHSYMVAI